MKKILTFLRYYQDGEVFGDTVEKDFKIFPDRKHMLELRDGTTRNLCCYPNMIANADDDNKLALVIREETTIPFYDAKALFEIDDIDEVSNND